MLRSMGRQWLQKNKEITANKKAKITSKLVREITSPAPTLDGGRLSAIGDLIRRDHWFHNERGQKRG